MPIQPTRRFRADVPRTHQLNRFGQGYDQSHAETKETVETPVVTSRTIDNTFDGRRAALLRQMQRTFGNLYVNEFIGKQIAAARGHNSPPITGPGSHGEPIIRRGRTLNISSMATDAYHASPVNPHNPVVVWTDGTILFFAPSQEQLTAGRTLPMPEPRFVPQPGFRAEQILWDRGTETSGSGSLAVVCRKTGAADIHVVITNTLEQITLFEAPGATSSAKSHVTREEGQFLDVDATSVHVDLTGGTAGPINGETFPDGFFRYSASGGTHDLYVAKGERPFAHIVERSTGVITRSFASGTIAAVVPEPNGIVSLETTTTGATATRETTTIDLRGSPPAVTTATGHTSSEVGYDDARQRLIDVNITIEEVGLRFRVSELEAIEDALSLGGGMGLATLQNFATLEASGPTILDISKRIGPDDARGLAVAGGGTPFLGVSEPFTQTETLRTATIRHEMTHVIAGAQQAVTRAGLSARDRANLEGSLGWEARQGLRKAREGLLRMGQPGLGAPTPGAGTFRDWRNAIGDDPQIANIWIELLRKYSFIPDPEGTGEIRGVSLADESRYSGASDPFSGHAADSADEFIASFVTCATVFRSAFIAAVVEAETAGNARGGGGGRYLKGLYSQAWDLISTRYVPLGTNPF
jgi:hypothetical protein